MHRRRGLANQIRLHPSDKRLQPIKPRFGGAFFGTAGGRSRAGPVAASAVPLQIGLCRQFCSSCLTRAFQLRIRVRPRILN